MKASREVQDQAVGALRSRLVLRGQQPLAIIVRRRGGEDVREEMSSVASQSQSLPEQGCNLGVVVEGAAPLDVADQLAGDEAGENV